MALSQVDIDKMDNIVNGLSDDDIAKMDAVITPELRGQNGEIVTPASVDYPTERIEQGQATKRGLHPVDFAKSVGKGVVHGINSIGTGLGRRFANPIRQAMGKRPLTDYEIENLYGKIQGLPEDGGAYKTGKFVGEMAPYTLLPEAKVIQGGGKLAQFGNRAITNGYMGGLATGTNSIIEKGFNPKENLKDTAMGVGSGIVLGETIHGVGNKIARYQRAKDIAKRRATPLAERMTPEQLERATTPASQYGVADIDSNLNAQIAEQMQNNINAEQDLMKEYRQLHSDMVKKYGSIDELKRIANEEFKRTSQTGEISEAVNDYRNLIEYEKTLGGAKYVNNDIKSSVSRQVENKNNISGSNNAINTFSKEVQASRTHSPIIGQGREPGNNIIPQNNDFITGNIKNTINGTGEVKNRGLAESVINAKGTPQEVKQAISENMPQYRVLHNNELTEQAVKEVEADFNNELSRLSTSKDFNDLDFEKARQLSKRLFDMGRNKEAINLIDNVSENATKQGRAIQALSLWSNMTPEGAVAKAQKLIKEANKKLPDKKQIKLTDEDITQIRNLQETALNTTDDLERAQALARTAKYISELIPSNLGQKLKAFRNISLLLNPKTLGRNIIGNALFNTVDTGSKALASGIDKIISLGTKKRTRVLPQLGDMFKGGVQGVKTGFQEALEGIDTRGLGQRFDLGSGRVFKNPVMRGLETGLDIGLRVPDRMQYEATFAESVANMMKAQGLKEPTQEILEQAEQEALESVFQNDSLLSDTMLGLRNNVINKLGLKDFGLGDLAIPYAQTPANLVQQGINYSPLGAIKGISNLVQGNQRQASLDLARALMGTGLIGTGYGLAKAGNMTPSQFEDSYITNRNVKNNLATIGIKPDSINGMWYSPFQPVSTSLAIGGAMANGENPTQAGLNTMLDLPFMQNANRFISDVKDKGVVDAGINFVSSIPAQFMPTALGQVAQYTDNVQRETYDKNKFKQGLNQAMVKIPGVSKMLPEKINVKGEPIQRYDSEGIKRMFDVFLNPTFINKPINDTTMQELKVLYDQTGSTKQFLPTVDKKIKFKQDGEDKTIELTGAQVSEYQQVLGRELYQNYTDLMNTEDYANNDDETRIKMLEKEKKRTKKYVDDALFSELKSNYSN